MSQTTSTTQTNPAAGATGGRSHLASGSKFSGDLSVPGLVEILGHVDGKVSADAVMIEASGSAEGELHAADVAIKGRFQGKILGRVVTLHSSAKVSGDILYETLCIESGAEVNSTCKVKKTG